MIPVVPSLCSLCISIIFRWTFHEWFLVRIGTNTYSAYCPTYLLHNRHLHRFISQHTMQTETCIIFLYPLTLYTFRSSCDARLANVLRIRRAVRRAAALWYQHSFIRRAITRKDCKYKNQLWEICKCPLTHPFTHNLKLILLKIVVPFSKIVHL